MVRLVQESTRISEEEAAAMESISKAMKLSKSSTYRIAVQEFISRHQGLPSEEERVRAIVREELSRLGVAPRTAPREEAHHSAAPKHKTNAPQLAALLAIIAECHGMGRNAPLEHVASRASLSVERIGALLKGAGIVTKKSTRAPRRRYVMLDQADKVRQLLEASSRLGDPA